MTPFMAVDAQLSAAASAPRLDVVGSPKPNYDNFYTPKNQDFYNQFEYVNLDRKERHIRLIRMHQIEANEDDSAIVRCDVVDNLPLASMERKFTTLSYFAGDPKKTEPILVNGIPFNAFANLGHALRQVRHYWRKNRSGEELLLWADQVCIDQSNSNERSHQVKFMGDIYAAAQQVLICLSMEGSPTGGFEWLKSAIKPVAHSRRITIELETEQFIDLNWSTEHKHRAWDAFMQTCLAGPWFKRAWVRQEFFRSQQAIFLAAFESAPYHDLLQYATKIRHPARQLRPFGKISQRQRKKCTAAGFCTLCRLLEDPSYFDHAWLSVTRLLTRKELTSYDLVQNLSEACFCQSSDQRDLIYAFLGYSRECYYIFPNYDPKVSYASLCTQLARNYLLQTGDLDILVKAYTRTFDWFSRDPSIPSWVPDWRVEPDIKSPLDHRIGKNYHVPNAAVTIQQTDRDHAEQVLTTRGLLLLTLGRRIQHTGLGRPRVDRKYWTNLGAVDAWGAVKAWGSSSEGNEVWILSGASQAFVFSRKGKYHELRGEATFLRPIDQVTESIEDAIKVPAADNGSHEYHDSQMAILVEKLNRLVEENDSSIQTINIC